MESFFECSNQVSRLLSTPTLLLAYTLMPNAKAVVLISSYSGTWHVTAMQISKLLSVLLEKIYFKGIPN